MMTEPEGARSVIARLMVLLSLYVPATMFTVPTVGTASTPPATVAKG